MPEIELFDEIGEDFEFNLDLSFDSVPKELNGDANGDAANGDANGNVLGDLNGNA